MCNVYNRGGYNRSGCGANAYQSAGNGSCGCSCGCWNGCWQRVCRDACGNLIVRNASACNTNSCGCCNHSCSCCNCCNGGSTNNDATTGNNGNGNTNTNGVFRCVTFCGYGNGTAATNNRSGCNCASAYYARQYGLTCDDNGECSYNFTND